MCKSSYYFKHDYGAGEDEKLLRVRMDHGSTGYGIYFLLLELLCKSDNGKYQNNIELIAYALREEKIEVVQSVIEDYGLFEFEGGDGTEVFYSQRLLDNMPKLKEQGNEEIGVVSSGKRKRGGQFGNSNAKTNRERIENESETNKTNRERIENESETNKTNRERIENESETNKTNRERIENESETNKTNKERIENESETNKTNKERIENESETNTPSLRENIRESRDKEKEEENKENSSSLRSELSLSSTSDEARELTEEEEDVDDAPPIEIDRKPKIGMAWVLPLWAEICPHLSQPKKLDADRVRALNARAREANAKTAEEFQQVLREMFQRMADSSFLAGDNPRNWKVTFDWLVKHPGNWQKVDEDNYDKNRRHQHTHIPHYATPTNLVATTPSIAAHEAFQQERREQIYAEVLADARRVASENAAC